MTRFFLMICVLVLVGCSDERKEPNVQDKENLKQFMHPQYDHRSLEERVRDSANEAKQKEKQK